MIRLATPPPPPSTSTVDDVVFAHATPGVRGKRLAAPYDLGRTPGHKEN